MFNILERYLAKTILNSFMITVFLLISLSGIIKFIEQLGKMKQGTYSILDIGLLTLLSLPKDIEIFFPMATLLGTLLAFEILSINNELTIMQALGFTRLYIAYSVIKTAIPLLLSIIIISEWVVPLSEQTAYHYRTKIVFNHTTSFNQHGLWIKDNNDFVFIKKIINNHKLIGINIYHCDSNKHLKLFIYAINANYHNGNWHLLKVNEYELMNINQIQVRFILNRIWKTNLTPHKLNMLGLNPNSLSISELYKYVTYLQHNKERYNRYQFNMWKKICHPLSIITMLLMATSFVLGPLHLISTRSRLIYGVSFSLLFYVLDQISGSFSIVYNILPILGTVYPSMIFLIISIIMLIRYK